MPKKKAPELTREEQFRRFVQAAKEAELEPNEAVLEDEFKRLTTKRRPVPQNVTKHGR